MVNKLIHLRCTGIQFFAEIIPKQGVKPDPHKVQAITDMPPPWKEEEIIASILRHNETLT